MNAPSLLLTDYLNRPDFGSALGGLSGDLASSLNLPESVDEIGLVCPNVLTAAEFLEKNYAGMKTFFLGEGSPVQFSESGTETPFTTRVGFGFYKGVILELAEPGIGSDIFGQTDTANGMIMINHLGFKARGKQLERKNGDKIIAYATTMQNAGISKRVEAALDVVGFIGHIHIFETMQLTHGVEIEFLDFRLFSTKGLAIGYPASVIGLWGWYQEKIGPRFLHMKAHHDLPPAPVNQ